MKRSRYRKKPPSSHRRHGASTDHLLSEANSDVSRDGLAVDRGGLYMRSKKTAVPRPTESGRRLKVKDAVGRTREKKQWTPLLGR